MPVCNKKSFFVAGFFSLFCSLIGAQSVQMPAMPEMPEISAPELGGSFYKPTIPYSPTTKKTTEKNKTESTETNNETILTDATPTNEFLSEFIKSNNILSSNDITSLYDSGSFSDLSSLLNSSSNKQTSDVLLKEILKSLQELKAEQKKLSLSQKHDLDNHQSDNAIFKTRNPNILRFKLKNHNFLDSLGSVFISTLEPDGTFLFTADRKLNKNGKNHSETIYLLFKTQKNNGSTVKYEVIPTIMQDKENTESYLYQLSQKKNLTATKTGNLIVFNNLSNDFQIDILLDIDQQGNN